MGGGYAGAWLVRALARRGATESMKVDLLERELEGAYERFELPSVLRGEASSTELVRYHPAWFEKCGATYHAGARVHLIDRRRRRVQADDLALNYDKLVLATGSAPYLPPIAGLLRNDGSLRQGVFTLRTLRDADAIVGAAVNARRVAVLGGGRLGVSIVEALCLRGVPVTLIQLSDRLMSDHLDDGAAGLVLDRIRSLGGEVQLRRRAVTILGDESLTGLAFHDGEQLACEAVILAAGVQPETWLGYQSGLSVERGIVVEGRLRSIDDFDVHALGECAEWRGSIHGLPEQIAEQAEVIAEHLLTPHAGRRYLGYQRGALYRVLGMSVSTLGNPIPQRGDDTIALSEPKRGRYKKLVLRSGRVAGAILLGDVRHADLLSQLYASCARLSHELRARLFDLSLPASSVPPPPAPTDEASPGSTAPDDGETA